DWAIKRKRSITLNANTSITTTSIFQKYESMRCLTDCEPTWASRHGDRSKSRPRDPGEHQPATLPPDGFPVAKQLLSAACRKPFASASCPRHPDDPVPQIQIHLHQNREDRRHEHRSLSFETLWSPRCRDAGCAAC